MNEYNIVSRSLRILRSSFGGRKFDILCATLLVVFILLYLIGVNRVELLDNDNYINYFNNSDYSYWSGNLGWNGDLMSFLAKLVTEEIGWRFWTMALSHLFPPEQSVYVTSVLTTLLVFLTALKSDRPFLVVFFWLIIPSALSVVGLFQIRQGFAFALFLFGVSIGRPLFWALIASTIHVTLIVPFVFVVFWLMSKNSKHFQVPIIVSIGLSLSAAVFGEMLFLNYGGRRVDQYSVDDGATSFYYVVSALIFLAFYISNFARHHFDKNNQSTQIFSIVGIGVCSFLVFSYAIFPVGTSRVGYFQSLLCVPLLLQKFPVRLTVNLRKVDIATLFVLAFISYQIFKILLGNSNQYIFNVN